MIEQGGVLGSLPEGVDSWADWTEARGPLWISLTASWSYLENVEPYIGWLNESYGYFSDGWSGYSGTSGSTWSEE